jgi:hypothetical protein
MGNKPKSKTRFILPVLTVSAICTLCAAAIWFFDIGGCKRCYTDWADMRATRAYCDAHHWTYTRADLCFLARYIQYGVKYSKKPPPGDLTLLPGFLEEFEPGFVEDTLVKRFAFDPETGTFSDDWGNPIRLVVLSPHRYRLLSRGPNAKDENGKGDDLAYDFDPLELRDVNEPNETTP